MEGARTHVAKNVRFVSRGDLDGDFSVSIGLWRFIRDTGVGERVDGSCWCSGWRIWIPVKGCSQPE